MNAHVIPMNADWRVVEDETDRAQHRLIEIQGDFLHAIRAAHCSARCVQLAERLGVAIALLVDAQDAAMQKADRL